MNLNFELKGAWNTRSILKISWTFPPLSTSPRDTLATCSPDITDKMATHATHWDPIPQAGLPTPNTCPLPQALALCELSWLCLWIMLLVQRIAKSFGVAGRWISLPLLLHFHFVNRGPLRGGRGADNVPDSLLPTFCHGCFPSVRGEGGRASPTWWTARQVQGSLWQSPWPRCCAGRRLSGDLGFPFSHCQFEGVEAQGVAERWTRLSSSHSPPP